MKKKNYLIIALTILLVLYFFAYPMTVFWDSGHYATYIPILKRLVPFSEWDMVRGIVFPGLIYLSQILFGETSMGILTLSFMFYIVMLISIYLMIEEVTKDKSDKFKKLTKIFVLLFVIIDPLVYGYYHALLTEFVAISISCLMCYLSLKWMNIDFFQKKTKYIIYSIVFVAGTVFSWHLKQPYVTITLFPLIIATLLSIIDKHNLKNIFQRLITVFSCIIILVCSIKVWNGFLKYEGVNTKGDRNVVAGLGNQLLSGINNYDHYKYTETADVSLLNEKELKKLEENPTDYLIMTVNNLKGKMIDQELLYAKNGKASSISSLKYIFIQMFKHPILVLDSYKTTYLAIADFYPKTSYDGGATYVVEKDFRITYCHENCVIGHSYLNRTSSVFYMPETYYKNVANYAQIKNGPIIMTAVLRVFSYANRFIYKGLMLILPLLLIAITVSYFKNKKYRKILAPAFIMIWYSFLHTMVHVVTFAYIDRYVSPIYLTTVFSLLLYIYYFYSKKIEQRKSIKKIKNSGKSNK